MKAKPLRREFGLLTRRVGSEAVVYEPATGKVHTLNETAAFVWDRLDGRHTLQQIAEEVASRWAVEGATALKDVKATLEVFRKKALL